MVKLVMINGANLYVDMPVQSVERYIKSGKVGCIPGWADLSKTSKVLISLQGISHIEL